MVNKPASAPMQSLDEAVAQLVAAARAQALGGHERLPTAQALGRVLASEVRSSLNVPPADNSAMDGYAVRCADVPSAGTVLEVSTRIPAGVVGGPLRPGTAARIFTGAQIPAGADAVLPQELCEALPGEGLGQVRFNIAPSLGMSIRRCGEDVALGATVLQPGSRLTPQALGLAASVGAAQLDVRPRPRVAMFSTGDELAMPGEPLKPGAIYNSNRFTLGALVQAAGCELTDLGIVPDRLDATRAALRAAAQGHDLVITCGGVSVGEEDHLKPAMREEGRLDLWQIAIKPGKPLAFGAIRRTEGGQTLFVGLPGNPVSAYVTFVVCVRPLLRALQGLEDTAPQAYPMRADFDWPKPDKRREFLRVQRNAQGGLSLYPNQGSGVLTSVVWADGLVDNPGGQAIARGDMVRFVPMAAWVSQ
jgi:molybdopterin molybdotransferase